MDEEWRQIEGLEILDHLVSLNCVESLDKPVKRMNAKVPDGSLEMLQKGVEDSCHSILHSPLSAVGKFIMIQQRSKSCKEEVGDELFLTLPHDEGKCSWPAAKRLRWEGLRWDWD